MTEQEIYHAVTGAGAGGGLILVVGKLFFQKLVKNLEDSITKVHDLTVEMSTVNVRLQLLDNHHVTLAKLTETVHSHDKTLAVLTANKK